MESLVAPAWKLINQASLIKKFNFLPSFFSTLILSVIVTYQSAITAVMVLHTQGAFFSWVLSETGSLAFWETVAAVVVAFVLVEMLITVYEGGLLSLVRAFCQRQDARYTYLHGLAAGLRSFLPVLEFDAFTKMFHPLTIATSYIFLLRIIGVEYVWLITAFALPYCLVAVVINVFISYARFFIVFEGKGLFAALSASTGMALEHLGTTMRLFLSMLLVYVRIVLIVAGILLFPVVATALFTWLGSGLASWLALSIAGIAYLGFLGFVAHVNSVLEIFVTTLWFRAWELNRDGGVPAERNSDLDDADADVRGDAHPALA